MNILYLKLIYIFSACIILFIFLAGKTISADQNITILADEISSNNQGNIIDATGEVLIINNDGTSLKADEVSYDKQDQSIEAKNNIIINDLEGNTYFLEEVKTFKGLDYLEGTSVRMRLNDGSRIVSKDISKKKVLLCLAMQSIHLAVKMII